MNNFVLGLLLGIALLMVLIYAYLHKLGKRGNNPYRGEQLKQNIEQWGESGACSTCGAQESCAMHTVSEQCHKEEVEYYNDEELDALQKRSSASYTEAELALLQEVFTTLADDDLEGWRRSLAQRQIALPPALALALDEKISALKQH